jgi:holo-[acyl-carrier protein] synthase
VIVGIGVDVVGIERAQRMLDAYGARALARTCTTAESAYVLARPNAAQHFAARLAAKEAAYKALAGTALARRVGWRDIEVAANAEGPPGLVFHGGAQARARELNVRRVWVSLTHGDGLAVAMVVLEGPGRAGSAE